MRVRTQDRTVSLYFENNVDLEVCFVDNKKVLDKIFNEDKVFTNEYDNYPHAVVMFKYDGRYTLGIYKNKERALEVLYELEQFIENKNGESFDYVQVFEEPTLNKIFSMPKE